jgi:hypothetical protein
MPAPKNPAKTARFNPTDLNRFADEAEAAWRKGVSPNTLNRQSRKTGKPKRYRLSDRRFGYWLPEVLDL